MRIEAIVQNSRFAKVSLWTICAGLALFGLFGYWRTGVTGAYFVDEGIHTFIGWAWGLGEWPYLHTWDQKGLLRGICG